MLTNTADAYLWPPRVGRDPDQGLDRDRGLGAPVDRRLWLVDDNLGRRRSRILEQLGGILEVHDGEVILAVFFFDAGAAPDNLFESGHGLNGFIEDDELTGLGIDSGGEKFGGGGNYENFDSGSMKLSYSALPSMLSPVMRMTNLSCLRASSPAALTIAFRMRSA